MVFVWIGVFTIIGVAVNIATVAGRLVGVGFTGSVSRTQLRPLRSNRPAPNIRVILFNFLVAPIIFCLSFSVLTPTELPVFACTV